MGEYDHAYQKPMAHDQLEKWVFFPYRRSMITSKHLHAVEKDNERLRLPVSKKNFCSCKVIACRTHPTTLFALCDDVPIESITERI